MDFIRQNILSFYFKEHSRFEILFNEFLRFLIIMVDWPGFLKWSLNYHDNTKDTEIPPMTEEQ